MKKVWSHIRFWSSYPFVILKYYMRRRKEWRKIIPRLWLSSGELLAKDLEYYQSDDEEYKLNKKFIEDFAKSRDDMSSVVKRQVILSFLIFIFLLGNYFSVGLDISIAGFTLKYAPGVPEGLLLIQTLLGCYTLLVQGNLYLLDSALKAAIKAGVPPELQRLYETRYFAHEQFGAYVPFNLPHIIPNAWSRGMAKFSAAMYLLLFFLVSLAYICGNLFLLHYHLWAHPNFGNWSYALFFYLLLVGITSFAYAWLTRVRLPYLDYTTNHELDILRQANFAQYQIRLQELYGGLNQDRAGMVRRGYLKEH